MMAYVYQSDLLCEDCGEAVRTELTSEGKAPADPENEHTYDSGDFPKGPYPDGGGEADHPCHCNCCGKFLQNPLTADGYAYVREALAHHSGNSDTLAEWRAFYGSGLRIAKEIAP